MKRGNIAAALLPATAALMTHCRRHTATNANAALPPSCRRCRQAAAAAAVAYVLFVVVVVVSIAIAAAAFS
jgi:hypothetical protein